MAKVFVVLNPVAGHSESEDIQEALERHLGDAGFAYECYETSGQESVPEVVRAALDRGFDLFVAAGGDGTVSGVVGGLVHAEKPMGIIPVGTGNAVARDLDIPLDVDQAVRLLVGKHDWRRVDVLDADGLFSVHSVSVGLSAQMMKDTESPLKRRWGRLAYIRTGIEKVFGLQTHSLTIVVDGHKNRVRATEVIVLNSGSIALADIRWGADVRLDDGTMDIYALRAGSLTDLLRSLWYVLLRRSESAPGVWHRRAEDSVAIRTRTPLPVQVDGDIVGETPVEIGMMPGSVAVIVPQAGGGKTEAEGGPSLFGS